MRTLSQKSECCPLMPNSGGGKLKGKLTEQQKLTTAERTPGVIVAPSAIVVL